jgi:hypothetical protein
MVDPSRFVSSPTDLSSQPNVMAAHVASMQRDDVTALVALGLFMNASSVS